MDGSDLRQHVESEYESQLSRLNSSKAMYYLTDGEMEAESVHVAAANDAAAARETFEAWADDEDDADAAEAFEAAADAAANHYDTVAPDGHDPDDPRPIYDALDGLDGTPDRAGGFLGWAVVESKLVEQYVGFFVGNADPRTADTYRDLKDDFADRLDDAEALVDAVAAEDDERARAAAERVVEAAYDDYVETLESMGIKPKDVC